MGAALTATLSLCLTSSVHFASGPLAVFVSQSRKERCPVLDACLHRMRQLWHVADAPLPWTVSPGSTAGFAPGAFGPKAAPPPKGGGSWQTSRPPAQGAPWPPQARPPPKTSAQPRPNYTTNFSVIGGREERGVRAPSFGECFLSLSL